LVRSGTSDLDVFGQIFSGDEYACVRHLSDVNFILDGGANVGYSAAYFLSAYPQATVVSVEPDAQNVALLRANLEPYGDRSIVLEAALWSTCQELDLTPGFRDGRHWSRQVRPPDGTVRHHVGGITVEAVMRLAGFDRISILKLDIEGAEAELFRNGYDAWVNNVDTFVVELHDDGGFGPATARFATAVASLTPRYLHSGELTIAHARSSRPPARHQPDPARAVDPHAR
jgi:FkbM family methyltransferase